MEEREGEEMRKGRSKEERQKNRGKKNKKETREHIYHECKSILGRKDEEYKFRSFPNLELPKDCAI